MSEFNSIEEVSQEIKDKIDDTENKKSIALLYAFNGTGKTRLSNEFNNLNDEQTIEELEAIDIEKLETEGIPNPTKKVLCYNAFLEDLFRWDNEDYALHFNTNSWEAELIEDEGLEGSIIDNFKRFLNTKIEPSFDLKEGVITFNIPSGDSESKSRIKISRGEESVFIWSVFYTILEIAIAELILIEENRSTNKFNDLEYIIIDDPVSSIDDTKIITLAVGIIDLMKTGPNLYIDPQIKKKEDELITQDFGSDYIFSRLKELKKELSENYQNTGLKFIITTHHPLFYNMLCNSIKRDKRYSYILNKINSNLELKHQDDSPFGYHLLVKDEIKKAVDTGTLQKYHFNLFRGLLEKVSNFIGIKNYGDCIDGRSKDEFLRLINLYSHNRLEPMEYREVSDEHKDLFKEKFEKFIAAYNFN